MIERRNVVKWNHDEDNLVLACGITREEYEAAVDKFNGYIQDMMDSKVPAAKSRVVQMIYEEFDPLMGLILMSDYERQKQMKRSMVSFADLFKH